MLIWMNMTSLSLVLPFIDILDLFRIFWKTTLWWASCRRHLIVAAPFCAPAALCLFKTCLFKSVHMLIVTFFFSSFGPCFSWYYGLGWLGGYEYFVVYNWSFMFIIIYIISCKFSLSGFFPSSGHLGKQTCINISGYCRKPSFGFSIFLLVILWVGGSENKKWAQTILCMLEETPQS